MKTAAPTGDCNAGSTWCNQLPVRWGNKLKTIMDRFPM